MGEGVHLFNIYEYENYINYLRFVGLDEGLIKCFSNIIKFDDNLDPTKYIDSLNETEVCRANKFIYDKVR